MKSRTFWGLIALIGILVGLGWRYLPTWPNWVSLLWVLAVMGLSGYGFIAKFREFFATGK
jgi:hypothetical protein